MDVRLRDKCGYCEKPSDSEQHPNQCPHCGMPRLRYKRTLGIRRFPVWFWALVIFCFIMMFWLPRVVPE